MSPKRHLSPDDRAYFGLLCETVFANPFAADRGRLARLLGNDASAPSAELVSQAVEYHRLMPGLDARLGKLAVGGLARLQDFAGEDRALMRRVFLFHCYQRFAERFDPLIARGGSGGLGRGLARELTEALAGCGFEPNEQRRWIALYYQLRRAYFFIDQALVGRSAPMRALRQALWNSVFTADLASYALLLWERLQDFPTLLLGETGTGKGQAAAAIGRSGVIVLNKAGDGFSRPIADGLIATNLSALSEGLIESELFGHRKGAFTGAVEHHEGLFARCDAQGTLFLDEIGDLSLPVQTKLLRLLQERSFSPVGSHEERRFAGRIVAATNRPLAALLGGDGFRLDLFYRLSANIITLPTLRERLDADPAELEELVDALLVRLAGDAAAALRARVLDALRQLPGGYPWPGNVRELEQAVRRIILTGGYAPDPLPQRADQDAWLEAAAAGRLDAPALLGGYCQRLYQRLGTYEAVARVTGFDRRTVKRHCQTA
ncbi:Fis family transcriptional regulator [Thiohalocapsa halophila]|uniref:Fis family transcriptional regulator n=1 Tax=Thiohalocapsa halophila TaxID=69359 RepID=A0ABS1CBU5_9GAMM|nr:sigma 54-interacting transcriptional regulator [Thiohalocapsa halophila]MBK1629392.1 Fis family transcriptional regulator [Thiohalocapsa halophila]